ncbi:MAG: FlaG protein [Steroidobacteraceae bacterium]|jgi:flagellar protein FlaG|nr:FlaG protein [Steroidobacteraceae bacterium]
MDTQAVSLKSSVPASEPVAKQGASVPPTPRDAPAVPSQGELRQRMAAVAQQMRDYLRSNGRDLEFRVDADTRAMVITVRETASGKVIRQIPNEEALQMRRHLDEWSGTFLNVTT